MAKNNSSIKKNGITTDVYDNANFVNNIKKEFTPDVDDDTLMLSTFGYFGEVMSNMLQNSVVMASEFANESIPTKAKFEKNIIAHALGLNINSLNANPAKMEVLLTFKEDEILKSIESGTGSGESWDGSGEFIFDCDNKIYFGDFEFHPDYDIIIRRIKLNNSTFTYTAMYDMTSSTAYDNPVSDITNPYLTPPVTMEVNGIRYLFTSCLLRQVEKTTIYKKVLSDNSISSKTINFDFNSQLAAFDVNVKNTNETAHLVPVYEGLSNRSKYAHVWYTYLDSSTIRLKFDRNSYAPRINSNVEVRLQTTQGEKGNFTWVADFPQFSFDSERLGYSNITVEVRPITGESAFGTNKKSIEDLKKIIPREALSRGCITTTKDLENFFNSIDTDLSQMYFYKRRDNNQERLYYSFIVMKDALSNIIPTNTVTLMIRPDQLYTDTTSNRAILKKGEIIALDVNKSVAYIYDKNNADDYTDKFFYIIPYNLAICLDPIYGMYFLTTMNENRGLSFSYINERSLLQYIATSIHWERDYFDTDNDGKQIVSDIGKYNVSITMEQNISDDSSVIDIAALTGETDYFTLDNMEIAANGNTTIRDSRINENCTAEFIPIPALYNIANADGVSIVCSCTDGEINVTSTCDYGLIGKINITKTLNGTETINEQIEKILSTTIRCFMVFYNEDDAPYRYVEGMLDTEGSDSKLKILKFDFYMTSTDYIDNYNRIRIDGVRPTNGLSDIINYGYMPANCNAMIHVLIPGETDLKFKDLFNDDADLGKMIPGLDGYRISNSYTINNGVNFFYNYSDIIYSNVSIGEGEYIPPDWIDPIPPITPPDYTIGDDTIDDPPSEYVIATEKAVKNAIDDATKDTLTKVPRYEVNDEGALIVTQNEEIITISDDDDKVDIERIAADNDDTTSDTDTNNTTTSDSTTPTQTDTATDTSDTSDSDNSVDSVVTGEGDRVIATEASVMRSINSYKQNIMDNVAKIDYDDEEGSALIYDKDKSSRISEYNHNLSVRRMMTSIKANDGIGLTANTEDSQKFHYIVKNVPVIKYGYFKNEDMVQYFANELIRRKSYIDEALTVLEDTFGMDFKFVNTYGPSKLFTLDNYSKYLNRVNLTLTFRIGLQVNYDDNIIEYIKSDIKEFMEDINSIDSIHMSNLVTEITNKYSESITFFEFIDMNGYGTSEQHLYAMPMPDDVVTPELVNVNTITNSETGELIPDINIIIA